MALALEKARSVARSVRHGFGELVTGKTESELRSRLEDFGIPEEETRIKPQLEQLLKEVGLPQHGKKQVLLARLVDHYESRNKSAVTVAGLDAAKPAVEAVDAKLSVTVEGSAKPAVEVGDAANVKTRNPAEIAPTYYHADLFRANFPLVQVHEVAAGMPFPVPDKFEGVKLEPKAAMKARKLWSKTSVEVSRFYRTPASEQQSFPHHLALLQGLKPFTAPPPAEIEKVKDIKQLKRKREDSDECDWTSVLDDDDECSGFDVETAVEEIQGVFGGHSSRNEGGEDVAEDSAKLEQDLKEHEDVPSGFADAVLHVYDYRPIKRRKQTVDSSNKSEDDVHLDRVAGILERKCSDDDSKGNAIYQGAFYASKYSMLNIQNGHGTPVYILVMTSRWWTYAKLVPEGYAQVCQGGIHPRSMEAFAGHQQITGLAESDLESLQQRLGAGTEFYRRNFRDSPQAVYCDGPMLVGHLYVRDEWFALPTTEVGGFRSMGSRRLFDGLMRLVIGDSVLQMTEAELDKRVQVNAAIQDLLEEALH